LQFNILAIATTQQFRCQHKQWQERQVRGDNARMLPQLIKMILSWVNTWLIRPILECIGLYSSESARDMSPDTMSSLYPDRPIRPLPKRRLRERLPLDVAESIEYPPTPKSSAPLFYYPYAATDEAKTPRPVEAQLPGEKERVPEIDQRNYISRRNPEDADSDEDELAYRSRIYPRHAPDTPGRAYRFVEKPEAARRPPQPPGSTTSSADGYDSFENTNNKKKRKIPTPGDSGMNGSHLSSDLACMGISSTSEDIHPRVDAGGGAHYSSPVPASASGLSGPGRGRYSRFRNGRSPLRALTDVASNWSNRRSSRQRQSMLPGMLATLVRTKKIVSLILV